MQISLQQDKNQAVWDVSKAVSAVARAKSQLDSTMKLVAVWQQVLDKQQKVILASAAVEGVINAQTDLATAEGNVVKARANYAKALIQSEQATGPFSTGTTSTCPRRCMGKFTARPTFPAHLRQPTRRRDSRDGEPQ